MQPVPQPEQARGVAARVPNGAHVAAERPRFDAGAGPGIQKWDRASTTRAGCEQCGTGRRSWRQEEFLAQCDSGLLYNV